MEIEKVWPNRLVHHVRSCATIQRLEVHLFHHAIQPCVRTHNSTTARTLDRYQASRKPPPTISPTRSPFHTFPLRSRMYRAEAGILRCAVPSPPLAARQAVGGKWEWQNNFKFSSSSVNWNAIHPRLIKLHDTNGRWRIQTLHTTRDRYMMQHSQR